MEENEVITIPEEVPEFPDGNFNLSDIVGSLNQQPQETEEKEDAAEPRGDFAFLADALFNAQFIKVNYHGTPHELHMTTIGDWCDLYTANDVILKQGESTLISLGVSMQLPDGYEAIIAARSSTFPKWGLIQTNGIGVIDNSYCGDDDIGKMAVYATRDVEISAGTRLCQFRIQKKQPRLNFVSVESLGNDNRGGFGEGTKDLD